jgi:uncharacterized protein (DUF58 family)
MMRALAGLSLLLLIGLLLGTSFLVYAAYVLLAVLWLSRYLSRRWADALRAVRTMSATEIEVGQRVQIQIRLENRDTLPIVWVVVDDVLPSAALVGPPPALAVDGSRLRICSVPASASRLVAYQITALRRGYYQIGPTITETGDLLGLHRRFRALTTPAFLLVLPKLIPLLGYDIASRRPVGEVHVTYRLMEDPTLIAGLREYRHGDPMRSVHWRATARTGQLQCKQYQPTSVSGATLVLDLHRHSNPDHHEPVRSDLAVTAAASICHTLLLSQQQFGLISNGRDAADRSSQAVASQEYTTLAAAQREVSMHVRSERLRPVVYPAGRGPSHFSEIHKALARLERTDGLLLEQLLLETQSRMPRDASVLVILQEVDDAAALALGLLRRQGYAVSAIVNNYENESFTAAAGRLMSQHIAVHHLLDEESIPHICKSLVLKF